jgi:type VI secretion system secreted protein Hcp
MRLNKYVVAAALMALGCGASAYATADDAFLKIDDVKGESTDPRHVDEIQVLAWSNGISNSATIVGGGGGVGKAIPQDLKFTALTSRASPVLYRMVASGEHIRTAVLTVRSSEKKTAGFEYLKYTLRDVLVTSLDTGGLAVEGRVAENVSLSFSFIEIEYTMRNADGTPGAVTKSCFDVKRYEVC